MPCSKFRVISSSVIRNSIDDWSNQCFSDPLPLHLHIQDFLQIIALGAGLIDARKLALSDRSTPVRRVGRVRKFRQLAQSKSMSPKSTAHNNHFGNFSLIFLTCVSLASTVSPWALYYHRVCWAITHQSHSSSWMYVHFSICIANSTTHMWIWPRTMHVAA